MDVLHGTKLLVPAHRLSINLDAFRRLYRRKVSYSDKEQAKPFLNMWNVVCPED